ncbi:MAG: hypothetical protein ACC726_04115 [Chloroflexota bacterium]
MTSLARTTFASTALALGLALTMAVGAAAQVATLRTPDPGAEASSSPADAEALDEEESILAFAACMRDNGIDMPDPQFGVGGGLFGRGAGAGGDGLGFDRQSAEFQSALEQCGSFLAALRPELDAEQQAERNDQRLALAECMRARDFDFPDPDLDGGFGFGPGGGAAFDFEDPDFRDAFGACQSQTGGFGFGPGGGGLGNDGVAE